MVEDFEEVFWGEKISENENNILVHIKLKFLAYLVVTRIPGVLVLTAFLLLGEWYAIRQILFIQTLLMIIFLILAHSIIGLTNNFFDKKLDIFARKHTIWTFKYISPKEMLLSATICSITGLFLLWHYFNFTIFIFGLIFIIITFIYSAPPIRLKTRAPMDVISNMLLFGSIPFILGWLITGSKLSFNVLVSGIIVGIAAMSYNLIIGWNDIKTDTEFGIKTTFVRLSYDWTINISIFLWVILLIFSIIIFYFDIITISFIIVFPVLIILWLKYLNTTDYITRQKNINFFLYISFLLWLFFIFFILMVLTKSIIPIISLAIVIAILLYNFIKHQPSKQKP